MTITSNFTADPEKALVTKNISAVRTHESIPTVKIEYYEMTKNSTKLQLIVINYFPSYIFYSKFLHNGGFTVSSYGTESLTLDCLGCLSEVVDRI